MAGGYVCSGRDEMGGGSRDLRLVESAKGWKAEKETGDPGILRHEEKESRRWGGVEEVKQREGNVGPPTREE